MKQDLAAKKEMTETAGNADIPVQPGQWVRLVQPVLPVLPVLLELLELLDLPAAPRDHPDQQERQERKDLLVRKDRRELKGPSDLRGLRVFKATSDRRGPKDPQARKASLVHKDL